MLITFTCKAYADITMFGDIGKQLLKMMGRNANGPGAILADDVPEILAQLKSSLAIENAKNPPDIKNQSRDSTISLKNRALTLIELLTAAAKEHCDVMWKTK